MDTILHKLCEKSQEELWSLLKEPCWTKDHAEVAFYMLEVLKGVKKMEHMEKVQEAMERAEELGEDGMEHMLGKEQSMHHYARRGGRRMPMRFGYDEGEWEEIPWEDKKHHRRPEWEEDYYPMSHDKEKEKHHDKIVASHFEKKYNELLEEKWEKEKKEKEKEQGSSRMPPPPPTVK